MIKIKALEDIGIEVPVDANHFYTEDSNIVFLIPFVEEAGCNVVFTEEEIILPLSDKQIESLKLLNCYGSTGWTLI